MDILFSTYEDFCNAVKGDNYTYLERTLDDKDFIIAPYGSRKDKVVTKEELGTLMQKLNNPIKEPSRFADCFFETEYKKFLAFNDTLYVHIEDVKNYVVEFTHKGSRQSLPILIFLDTVIQKGLMISNPSALADYFNGRLLYKFVQDKINEFEYATRNVDVCKVSFSTTGEDSVYVPHPPVKITSEIQLPYGNGKAKAKAELLIMAKPMNNVVYYGLNMKYTLTVNGNTCEKEHTYALNVQNPREHFLSYLQVTFNFLTSGVVDNRCWEMQLMK